jgi:hypothetical protein
VPGELIFIPEGSFFFKLFFGFAAAARSDAAAQPALRAVRKPGCLLRSCPLPHDD